MKKQLYPLTLSALLLALGMLLPFLTGQIPAIGEMLLPLHIPVLLCGLVCGWRYGAAVGATLPLLRTLCFGMPPIATAVTMAFELCAYGAVIGLIYARSAKKNIASVYISLIVSMIVGRAVWGVTAAILYRILGSPFGFKEFLLGAFIDAVPGILLQLVLIPAILFVLQKADLLPQKN